jgi:hypothetical protein
VWCSQRRGDNSGRRMEPSFESSEVIWNGERAGWCRL